MAAMIEEFGATPWGERVARVVLSGGGLRVPVLTWGAVIQDVWLDGVPHSLTPGSDRLEDYMGAMRHHGSLIGPVVNRLSGAQAPLDGRLLAFEANLDGRLTLHSGAAGTHLKVWRIVAAEAGAVTLALTLAEGEGGFPGTREVTARLEIAGDGRLRLSVRTTTDAPTYVNFANHSYWNLDGSAVWTGHVLQVAAEAVLPTDADFAPTGEIRAVEGTALDFRSPRAIAPGAPPLDTCFCLAKGRRDLAPALWLTGRSGLRLAVATTEPGVQVYDGRAAIRPGRGPFEGLAIEAQGWPDAPNHAAFPSIRLDPGQVCLQVTEWTLTRPGG
jgi:aldose 1-epimerase